MEILGQPASFLLVLSIHRVLLLAFAGEKLSRAGTVRDESSIDGCKNEG